MATTTPQELPSRQGTGLTSVPTGLSSASTNLAEDAVPDADPSSTAGLLAERIQAWKHICGYLEDYIAAVEKAHKENAKEYEKVLKTIAKPLREGQHFDTNVGGISAFFDNMRANTQAMINTNLETEKNLKGSVLPILDRLHKEIKAKAKELASGAQRGAKEVEKARATTQKHIELLGQQTAVFEATGGKLGAVEDPYVLNRGVVHRLHRQVVEENNHHNDLVSVQMNFETFEAHVILVLQQAMEVFHQFVNDQADRTSALYGDMLGAIQRIPHDLEWTSFKKRFGDILADPNEAPRTVESITFPNQDHPSTHAVIEGSLERKSRNKLNFSTQTGYYVVTPSRYLHEFRDSDDVRKDPVPELSIYLPDATISAPNGDKFAIKGKDRGKSVGSRLAGSSELHFKTHSPAEAEKWFYIIRDVAGSAHAAHPGSIVGSTPTSPTVASPTSPISSTGKPTTPSPPPAAPAAAAVAAPTAAIVASTTAVPPPTTAVATLAAADVAPTAAVAAPVAAPTTATVASTTAATVPVTAPVEAPATTTKTEAAT